MKERHRLLARQLRKTLGEEHADVGQIAAFLDLVDATYRQADDERALLEHSMATVSEELGDRYRRLQEALVESRRQEKTIAGTLSLLRSVVDSTEDGLLVVDLDGGIELYNQRFARIWSLPAPILEQANDGVALAFVLDQLADPEAFMAKVEELYGMPHAESMDLIRFKDGRLLERFSMPHRIQGEIVGRVWSFRDVSKRTRLEEQLRQAQKMEAIGHLAGGVAHDFNNLLTVMLGHAELLAEKLGATPSLAENVGAIVEAAHRASKLTRQLLAFGRRQILQPEVLDLNQVLRDLESMLRRLIRENVEIRLQLAPGVGRIFVDRGQLEQMILNLAVNARDAMPEGGVLSVAVGEVEATLDSTWAAPDGASGAWIALAVADTGSGIPEELRSRIFEPFFTTKPEGQGTGLGLAMVYGFVQQSGGKITVESEVGRGTSFRIFWPRVEQDASAVAPTKARRLSGIETILLVEDERDLREISQQALELRGYRVLAAESAEAALALVSQLGTRFDLLLTDVVMTGLGGAALAQRMRDLQPGIKLLFISGYTDNEVVRQGVRAAKVHFLEKPFTLDALGTAVRVALDTPLEPPG